ncbi:unnamed protein product [Clonostachys solani]|uniref:Peptidase M43 pregnancy-associated plasma-A domain-containing protein n=1 Tax=Clonostachys solani TaxID=160281 RepID=A0A9N9Z8Z7_9HYPO|nr:unnamed protein product [Clonostachys solani]
MHFSLLLLGVAGLSHGLSTNNHVSRCGNPEPSIGLQEVSRRLSVEENQARVFGLYTKTTLAVDVYFHTISASSDTLLSDPTLNEQFNILSQDYGVYGINLNLAGISKTVNATWSRFEDQLGMKTQLRNGTYKDLNIYFLDSVGGAYGVCTYPLNTTAGSTDFYLDGCTVLATTVPGGTEKPYDLGKTATHEVGHWFGLFHTFNNGCNGGDEVDDTPPQATATYGCPASKDTCPDKPGEDPIHNYMDYSDDECMYEFTEGQINRILSFWTLYRS